VKASVHYTLRNARYFGVRLTRRLVANSPRPTKAEPAFSHKSLAFVWMVMRVAVTTPVKEVTTLFVSGASSVNVPEK
jgi:hypothetical protein